MEKNSFITETSDLTYLEISMTFLKKLANPMGWGKGRDIIYSEMSTLGTVKMSQGLR